MGMKMTALSIRVIKNTSGPKKNILSGGENAGHFVLGGGARLSIQNKAVKDGQLTIGIGSKTRVGIKVHAGDTAATTAKALVQELKSKGFENATVKSWVNTAKVELFKLP